MCWKTRLKGSLENPCTSDVYADTKRGISNIRMVQRIARMIFSSRMKDCFIRKRVLVLNVFAAARHVGRKNDSHRRRLASEVRTVCQTRERQDIRYSRGYQLIKTVMSQVCALHR